MATNKSYDYHTVSGNILTKVHQMVKEKEAEGYEVWQFTTLPFPETKIGEYAWEVFTMRKLAENRKVPDREDILEMAGSVRLARANWYDRNDEETKEIYRTALEAFYNLVESISGGLK